MLDNNPVEQHKSKTDKSLVTPVFVGVKLSAMAVR